MRQHFVAGRRLDSHFRPTLVGTLPVLVQDMRTSATAPVPAYVTVAPSATANTKGSFVELIAATTHHADLVSLLFLTTALASDNGGALADFALGGAGSEVVVAADILVGNIVAAPSGRGITLPVQVPQGSRISVRWQSARTASASATVACNLYAYDNRSGICSPTKLDSIGANTGTSLGTSTGTTSNVWTELSSAAPRAYQGFVIGLASSDTSMATGAIAIDVGVGASGAERAVESDCAYGSTTGEAWTTYPGTIMPGFLPIHCPAGARIAVRVRDSQQSANNPTVALLGVPYA